jgi:hypothetical protein
MTTEERLAKVERELGRVKRGNRWLLAALGLALGAWIMAGTLALRTVGAEGGGAAVNEVRARRIVLADDQGRERGVLQMAADGPTLVLCDAMGKVRATLSAIASGPGLALYDAEGKGRAALVVLADGPRLALRGATGKVCAILSGGKDGPRLGLLDAAGKPIWSAP